ncbi:LLM class flavin-dependent oxidoreductase [Pseudomonas sp. TWR2-1-1]|uniref:LLM class flavin-dependent oxidoreductase n=1 Tax=Pseudomonas sp. TWR2-1-1 TaxID=2804610 RepID=UPI003CE6ECC7
MAQPHVNQPFARDTFAAPLDFADSPLSKALKQPLLLGVFLNMQDIRLSNHPTSNTWTFDYNAKIVQQAEALGFELAFSRTQWLPKGGYDGEASLDSFIALGAMAAITHSILLVSTIHVLYGPLHPLHIAKYGATLDHIAKGRWGINIVTGHRPVEHEMFGRPQVEHDERYQLAGELFDVLNTLWSSDRNFSYEGRHGWKIKDGYITPKPQFGRPLLVTATGSEAGIDFAASQSDLVFITNSSGSGIRETLEDIPAHVQNIKARARQLGREVRTIINPIIVSRDTEEQTREYLEGIIGNKVPGSFGNHKAYASDAHAWRGRTDGSRNTGLGLGGNIEIIGTPEQVVEQLVALKAAGIDGVQLNFHDFALDLAHFGERILPLLKQAGLRL